MRKKAIRNGFEGISKCFIILLALFVCLQVVGVCVFAEGPVNDDYQRWIEPKTGMEFVKVPAGCFTMGSPPGETGRDTDEGPQHEVCLDGFWIGRFEVTVREFRIFVEKSGYKTEAEREGFSWIYTGSWEKRKGFSWRRPGFVQGDDYPVVNVSWNDAKKMAEWLSKETGRHFSLPTEAQWEYACRGGTTSSRFWGTDPGLACKFANVADISAKSRFPAWQIHQCDDGFVFTAPVGSFKPNPYGLYDMLGNVWEWCEDTYLVKGYCKFKRVTRDPLVKKNGIPDIVIRGGSWYSRPRYVRCASRDHLHDSHRRGNDVGFRLVILP